MKMHHKVIVVVSDEIQLLGFVEFGVVILALGDDGDSHCRQSNIFLFLGLFGVGKCTEDVHSLVICDDHCLQPHALINVFGLDVISDG